MSFQEIEQVPNHQHKSSKKDSSKLGLQLKSLQALFDPRTLHQTCCVERTPKTTSRSSKPPLRKRNLPQSFFREPVQDFQSNRCDHNFEAVTSCSDMALVFDDVSLESVPTLPSGAFDSLIDHTDFPDIVAEQWYSEQTQTNPDNNGNATICQNLSTQMTYSFTPQDFSDCSGSSCDQSPVNNYITYGNEISSEHQQQLSQSISAHMDCSYADMRNIDNTFVPSDDSAKTCLEEFFDGIKSDGFLPLLNESAETNKAAPSVNGEIGVTLDNVSEALPAFPQAFYGQSGHEICNGINKYGRTDISEWTSASLLQPCYTYL